MIIDELEGAVDATGLRVAVIQARFNESITDGLLAGALDVLERAGAAHVTVVKVPGAFELPVVAARLAATGFDAIVAVGAVILGETDHYEHIAHRSSEGLARVMLETGVPVSFGILTVRSPEHARVRSEPGPGNKGGEAAEAAVRAADLLRRLIA